MTAAVWRFVHLRLDDCLCRGRRQVTARRVGRSAGSVMPCPQCTDPAALELFVANLEQAVPVGDGAA
jgi:hypothetical protein